MSEPFVGEIRMFGGNFAPAGWAFCDGQLMSIASNDVLFTLIGTTYGGNGTTTFALPDLRGRAPVHQGTGFPIGGAAGTPTVTLTVNQLPAHSHPAVASLDSVTQGNPTGNVTGASASLSVYKESVPANPMNANVIQGAGGSQPHDNMQPYVCVSFIISLFGIYPPPP